MISVKKAARILLKAKGVDDFSVNDLQKLTKVWSDDGTENYVLKRDGKMLIIEVTRNDGKKIEEAVAISL